MNAVYSDIGVYYDAKLSKRVIIREVRRAFDHRLMQSVIFNLLFLKIEVTWVALVTSCLMFTLK